MANRIILRRDTAANWDNVDPVLANGEIGLETDTERFKIGNGIAPWSERAYYANADYIALDFNAIIDGRLEDVNAAILAGQADIDAAIAAFNTDTADAEAAATSAQNSASAASASANAAAASVSDLDARLDTAEADIDDLQAAVSGLTLDDASLAALMANESSALNAATEAEIAEGVAAVQASVDVQGAWSGWVPECTGFTVQPGWQARYAVVGKTVTATFTCSIATTSGAHFQVKLPLPAARIPYGQLVVGTSYALDPAAALWHHGMSLLASSGATADRVSFHTTAGGYAWGDGGTRPFTWVVGSYLSFTVTYECA